MSTQYSILRNAVESINTTSEITSGDLAVLSDALVARATELGVVEVEARGYNDAFAAIGSVVVGLGASSAVMVK